MNLLLLRDLYARLLMGSKERLADLLFSSNTPYVLLPLCAFEVWFLALGDVNVRRMTDIGLVSVFPSLALVPLAVVVLSYCCYIQRPSRRVPIIFLHLVLLIFMLYGITTLVEEAPRFAALYRHAGYTDYIMRTGTVDPSLDAYFNWPGFFILSAFVTKIAGYHDILAYAAWAPVFFNLLYLPPLYLILASFTFDRRVVWFGILCFYLTNWIGQDYFSPQGLNFFFYLVMMALIVRWFSSVPPRRRALFARSGFFQRIDGWINTPDVVCTPATPRQRRILLACLVAIFAFMVFSHPLTPFFAITSVTALVLFRRCSVRWLPLLMIMMVVLWSVFMAQAYLVGHMSELLADLVNFRVAVTDNVTARATQGSPGHTVISAVRLMMTAAVWGLALVGSVYRSRQGYRDVTCALLALAPFPLLLVQSYGGEMLMRIYLFTLPAMVFFMATLFYSLLARKTMLLMTALLACIVLSLLGGFLFTRYGNERADYVTSAELTGVRYLYDTAPPGSLLLAGWDGTPWEFQHYEQYTHYSASEVLSAAVMGNDTAALVRFVMHANSPRAYLIFTRSQRATADADGLPAGTLDRLERSLLASGKFRQVYQNPDVQIFVFVG